MGIVLNLYIALGSMLIITEMQIITKMRFPLMAVTMATIKKSTKNK